VRYVEDIISVWNKTAEDLEARRRLHNTIKQYSYSTLSLKNTSIFPSTECQKNCFECRILGLPEAAILEYKAHDQAIKDNSSFRNTEGVRLPVVPPLFATENKSDPSAPTASIATNNSAEPPNVNTENNSNSSTQ
jgi:hypothetical protein